MTIVIDQYFALRQKLAIHAVRNIYVVRGLIDRFVIEHHDFAAASVPPSVMFGRNAFGHDVKRESIVVIEREFIVERFVALDAVRRMNVFHRVCAASVRHKASAHARQRSADIDIARKSVERFAVDRYAHVVGHAVRLVVSGLFDARLNGFDGRGASRLGRGFGTSAQDGRRYDAYDQKSENFFHGSPRKVDVWF